MGQIVAGIVVMILCLTLLTGFVYLFMGKHLFTEQGRRFIVSFATAAIFVMFIGAVVTNAGLPFFVSFVTGMILVVSSLLVTSWLVEKSFPKIAGTKFEGLRIWLLS